MNLAARRRALDERRFPVLVGHHPPANVPKSVPWAWVARFAQQAEQNHSQTLERLAERGGLGADELWAVVHGKALRDIPVSLSLEAASAWLNSEPWNPPLPEADVDETARRPRELPRCRGCGAYVQADPETPDGRGHRVTNADGSPGYCGPADDVRLTEADVEAIWLALLRESHGNDGPWTIDRAYLRDLARAVLTPVVSA